MLGTWDCSVHTLHALNPVFPKWAAYHKHYICTIFFYTLVIWMLFHTVYVDIEIAHIGQWESTYKRHTTSTTLIALVNLTYLNIDINLLKQHPVYAYGRV